MRIAAHRSRTLPRALSTLLADNPDKNRWSRNELLDAIDWPDRFALRFTHTFPVGAYVQRNEATEARLLEAIATHTRGYVALVGPPGAGKSTLCSANCATRQTSMYCAISPLYLVPRRVKGAERRTVSTTI